MARPRAGPGTRETNGVAVALELGELGNGEMAMRVAHR